MINESNLRYVPRLYISEPDDQTEPRERQVESDARQADGGTEQGHW